MKAIQKAARAQLRMPNLLWLPFSRAKMSSIICIDIRVNLQQLIFWTGATPFYSCAPLWYHVNNNQTVGKWMQCWSWTNWLLLAVWRGRIWALLSFQPIHLSNKISEDLVCVSLCVKAKQTPFSLAQSSRIIPGPSICTHYLVSAARKESLLFGTVLKILNSFPFCPPLPQTFSVLLIWATWGERALKQACQMLTWQRKGLEMHFVPWREAALFWGALRCVKS